MNKMNMRIIDWLLSESRSSVTEAYPEFDSFRQAFHRESDPWEDPVDRAIVGGFITDCVAFAFAAGYASAMQCLVPGLPKNAITCFCITEAGGGHPRAVKSQLVFSGNNADQKKIFTLNGKKKFITCAKEADFFLVAASEGTRDDGKNSIRMMKIDSKTPGIRVVPMNDLSLVPEISHCELIFTDVTISEADLLPGDGYIDYIRPFRTIEDLHISAGILGYLFRNACKYDWGRDIQERILGHVVSVRTLALSSPTASEVHIVIGGVLKQIKELFKVLESFWEQVGGEAQKAWDRDKILMDIADKARTRRLQAAWEFYEAMNIAS
ncbi:MAG: acyl-CoA dehydrogenase family protein [Desulfobacteraceae bacterium]|nr:acyl-CoA dehydrogenase family protein [Desulfobacteraceae bacterium]